MTHSTGKQAEAVGARRGREVKQPGIRGSSRPRAAQQAVLARLQSLFPNVSSSPRASGMDASVPIEPNPAASASARPSPRFLKVRVISWNMHDSLPKGNLEDLLGTVPPYVPVPNSEPDKLRIPNMSNEDGHPYHLIVVAGQECPTSSGIPMGLGASFRYKEKDRLKDGDRTAKKAKIKDSKEKDKAPTNEQDSISMNNPPLTPTGDAPMITSPHASTSGWSWILEEWYCHGLGQRDDNAATSTASELYESQAASVDQAARARAGINDKENDVISRAGDDRKKIDDNKRRKYCCKDKARIGPYELLVKERLMGIYMAIFVYRDVKPLVRGISKSSVSTGLIGGRVGNKGGVGISLNIDGTTLLFINAHLAAHEDRVMNRVANFTKIKSDLQVNDFLSQDDPRVMAEDLLDKFDYTFVFGDLNFRLDLTRLHADWLISRRDFDQALSFDQLRALMSKGEAFVGFREAPIRFPPTFKYDVVKSIKREKTEGSRDIGRALSAKRWLGGRSIQNLSEVQETEASTRLADEERGGSMEIDEDNGSFVSAAITTTSMQSRSLLNADLANNDGSYARSTSPHLSSKSKEDGTASSNNVVQRIFATKAALKAKAKWFSLVKQGSSRPIVTRSISKASHRSSFSASYPQFNSHTARSDNASSKVGAAASAIELGRRSAPSYVELRRTSSKKSVKSAKSSNILSTKDGEKSRPGSDTGMSGMYDTSSKQRVPSWCDRILWKTTVVPEPESEDDDEETTLPDNRNSGLGPRMLAFLTHALRPLSSRTRTASLASLPSATIADASPSLPPPVPEEELSRSTTARSDSRPLMRRASVGSEKDLSSIKIKALANMVNLRQLPSRKPRNPKLLKSRSIEPTSTSPNTRRRRSRAYTAMPVISAPSIPLQEDTTLTSNARNVDPPPVPPKDGVGRQRTTSTRGWLRLPFFTKDSESEHVVPHINLDSPQRRDTPLAKSHKPRRGDVVALRYDSLDDHAMRRLEGRSDHRPVIGSYIIYI